MFLTQKYPITITSVDGKPNLEIRSEEVIRQNAYLLQEIENVLNDYPEYPYQVAFSIEELRFKLVTHVLSNIPNCCSVNGQAPKLLITEAKLTCHSTSERVRLDVLIRGSILHLLRENADWISHQIQNLDKSAVCR